MQSAACANPGRRRVVRSNLLEPRASVVIPTLTAGDKLARCLDCLEKQTFEPFDIYIVDNSGEGLAAPLAASPRVTLIRNSENVGFGAAINQAVVRSSAEFICTLNDDAYPSPEWLAELVNTCVGASDVGLCASRIFLGEGRPTRFRGPCRLRRRHHEAKPSRPSSDR